MKIRRIFTLSILFASMMVMAQSAFADKLVVSEDGSVVLDKSNNGSGSAKKQPTRVICHSSCNVVVK